MSIAPLDARPDFDGNFGIVGVECVALCYPWDQLGVGFIGIEEVKRLVEEVVADARDATRDKGVERVVVLDLAGAGVALGAVHDQGAAARNVFEGSAGVLAAAAGDEWQAAKEQGIGDAHLGTFLQVREYYVAALIDRRERVG